VKLVNSQADIFLQGGVKCSMVTRADLLRNLLVLLADKAIQPRTINCLNAHICNLAFNNPELSAAINRSCIVAADGMSVVWAARFFGYRLKERCNMTEAFRLFLADRAFPESTAIVIGCTQDEAERAADNIRESSAHCAVSEAFSGFLEIDAYTPHLQKHQDIDFVFTGMGSPKSEVFGQRAAELCPRSIIWHIGGGTIKFLAGTDTEAPEWMRRRGLQWVHRLLLDPRRMWKRYLIGNVLFVSRTIKFKLFNGLR
jgi:N-acetylglucosaminyldiphosphoundecaprenol N-acetyl-beta-D-mannosaminyltransferase